MAPPVYGGLVALNSGSSTNTVNSVTPYTGYSEFIDGDGFYNLNINNASSQNPSRGWTRSPPIDLSTIGGVLTIQHLRQGGAVPGSTAAYPNGFKLVLMSGASPDGSIRREFLAHSGAGDLGNVGNSVRPLVTLAGQQGELVASPAAATAVNTGSINLAAITRIEILCEKASPNGVNARFTANRAFWIPALISTVGDTGNPITFQKIRTYLTTIFGSVPSTLYPVFTSYVLSNLIAGFGVSLTIGNGSTFTQMVDSGFSVYFQSGVTEAEFNTSRFCDVQVPPFWYIFRIKSSPTDVIDLTGSISCATGFQFIVDTFSGTPTITLTLNLSNASPVTLRSGVNFSGSLLNCGELAGNGATLSNVTITDTTGASGWNPVLGSTATNVLVQNCNHGIRITASGSYSAMHVTLRNNTIADVLVPTGVTGAINLNSVVFPSGSTTPTNILYDGVGTVTITVNRAGLTTSTPNGGTVVLVLPVISLTAPNFQQGTNVEVSRVNTYTLAAGGINIATGVITLSGHQFRSTGVPTLIAIVRQPSAVLPTASTPFERVDPGGAITPLLLSVVNVSGSTFQLATSDGGTPITFSNAGSGNFTIQGFTRLDFSAAGVSGYTVTLTEETGTLLEVKARFWQNVSGCTASSYYQARFIWSSVAGLEIADTLTVADTPDTVHNTLIGRVLTLANGTIQTVAADGSAIAGMSANQNGIVDIDRASGLLLTQDAYCWFVWYSSTSTGIRLTNKEALTADSLFDFVLTLIQIRNVNAVPLEWLGGYIRTNNGSRLIATGSNAIYPNAGQAGIAIAVSSGGGGGLDAAGVRSAIGLASANLDTQLSTANTRIG